MIPSIIGVAVLLIGLWLMSKPPLAMLSFVLFCTLFGGSAALYLPALGSSSIPPAHFALTLLALRLVLVSRSEPDVLAWAIRRNWAIVLFGAYGLFAALLLPHVFAGGIELTPQNGRGSGNLFFVTPLRASPQNITQGIYLVGAAVAAVLAAAAARRDGAEYTLTKVIIGLGAAHVAFGVIDVVSNAVGVDVLAFFRNGLYGQLDQEIYGFHRISGVLPEASSYAGYAGVLLVLNTELWLRDAMPRWTGACAAALTLAIIFCTSSTGYLLLAVYAPVLACRLALFPGRGNARKGAVLFMIALFAVNAVVLLVALNPAFTDSAWRVLMDMTVNKATSVSGVQRAFWAQQGWSAFVFSNGLGVGPGSFRSSNLFLAVLGTMGVAGILLFGIYIVSVFSPLRRSTYLLSIDGASRLAPSCGWAVLMGLVPAIAAAASPDPGIFVTLLGGIAFALRDVPSRSSQSLQREKQIRLAPSY